MANTYRPLDYSSSVKLMDLEEQLKIYQEELLKKDEAIRTLTRLRGIEDSTSGITGNPGSSKVTEPRDRLTAKEASLLHLREQERYKEFDTRQHSLIQSLNHSLRHTQELPGTVTKPRSPANCSIHHLQDENKELRERISELEERLRLHLREREQSEQMAASMEKRLTTGIEKLAHGLNTDTEGQRDPLDYLASKASELFQEHLLWEARIATLEETLANQELEFRAGRQSLMKLVSDAGKAQQTAASYSEDMKTTRKERDEAFFLKKKVEQENALLRERLEDCQRALGTACQAQARNEKQVSDLDDRLRSTAYQTRAANALHQSFIDQLATLLSNGFVSVPATQEDIKSKVQELSGNYQTQIFRVKDLEGQIAQVNKQLEQQSEIYHQMLGRARKAEEKLKEREETLRHLEGQLAAEDLLKDGRQFERQKHRRFLQQLTEAMKVEQDLLADDWESQSQRLVARARQLTQQEAEALSDNQELLQSLQRKVTSQREKLASSKHQVDFLTAKLKQLEATIPDLENAAGVKDKAVSKLQHQVQRLQQELKEAKIANRNLTAKCAEITTLKAATREQSRTIERLSESLEKLEAIKEKAAEKVVTLRSELDQAEHGAWERNEQTHNTLTALRNELRSTKRVLQEVARRERQLVDFREFVTRALGFDTNSMAVPDEKVYHQLKSLVEAQRSCSRKLFHSDSSLQGSSDRIGVRYLGSQPTHSVPSNWGQRRH